MNLPSCFTPEGELIPEYEYAFKHRHGITLENGHGPLCRVIDGVLYKYDSNMQLVEINNDDPIAKAVIGREKNDLFYISGPSYDSNSPLPFDVCMYSTWWIHPKFRDYRSIRAYFRGKPWVHEIIFHIDNEPICKVERFD